MPINKDTVRKVLGLARLEEKESELDALAARMNGILSWIEQLQAVNTDGVEPLANVVDIKLKLRTDEVTDGGNPAKVLSNGAEVLENYFVVPKVVE